MLETRELACSRPGSVYVCGEISATSQLPTLWLVYSATLTSAAGIRETWALRPSLSKRPGPQKASKYSACPGSDSAANVNVHIVYGRIQSSSQHG